MKAHNGAAFGCWTVVSQLDGNYVQCQCACGTIRSIYRSNLTSGKTMSCGCDRSRKVAEARTTHGMFGTPTYSTWSSMMTRCTNPNSKSFNEYGGRGISVCDEWKTFSGFFASMGEKPAKGMSIERLDVNGNYEPGNCVWANATQQARNTRRTKLNASIVQQIRDGAVSTLQVMKSTGCAKSTVGMAKRHVNWSGTL